MLQKEQTSSNIPLWFGFLEDFPLRMVADHQRVDITAKIEFLCSECSESGGLRCHDRGVRRESVNEVFAPLARIEDSKRADAIM